MKSDDYLRVRIISQTISIMFIIANFAFVVYVFFKFSIYTVETTLESELAISFYYASQCIGAINILLALMTNCIITSGIKILMYFYSRIAYTHMVKLLLSIIYFYVFYIPALTKGVNQQITSNPHYIATLRSFGLAPVSKSFQVAFQEEVEFVVSIFCVLQAITIIGNYIQIRLFRYTMSLNLKTKEDPSLPEIKTAKSVGFKESRLIQQNIIDLNQQVPVTS